jgi:DNA-binding MarR family transcriptional regulator
MPKMKQRRTKRSATKAKKGQRDPAAAAERLALGQLDSHLGYFVRRLQIWIFQDFIRTLAPMKVRPAQYSVLLIVETNPGRSQASVGQTLGIERARLARMLHELERRKWIARHSSGSDARSHSLYLTAAGEKALAKIKTLARRHEVNLRALLGRKRHKESLAWFRDLA